MAISNTVRFTDPMEPPSRSAATAAPPMVIISCGKSMQNDFEMAAGEDVAAEDHGEEGDNADDLKHAEPVFARERSRTMRLAAENGSIGRTV